MLALLLLLAFTDPTTAPGPEPINLDTITVEHAERLQGHHVRTSFVFGCPPQTYDELTVFGPGDDELVRTVFTKRPTNLDVGDSVSVVGVLSVIRHEEHNIGDTVFPAFTEIRVEPATIVK